MSWWRNLAEVMAEARRRRAVQRALYRGERLDGLGLVGHGLDAVIMCTPSSLQEVDPVDRLLRYVNGAAMFPPRLTRYQEVTRRELGHLISKAWRQRRYPGLIIRRRLGHMTREGVR